MNLKKESLVFLVLLIVALFIAGCQETVGGITTSNKVASEPNLQGSPLEEGSNDAGTQSGSENVIPEVTPLAEINETNDTQEEPPTVGECTDSDGGKNYNMTGTADNNGKNQHGTDYCVSGYTSYNLIEFYCSASGEVANEGVLCSNGCVSGACILNATNQEPINDTQEEPPVTGNCLDSDSGRNYNARGNTDNDEKNQHGIDYCVSSYPSTYNLIEYFCNSEGNFQSEGYLCLNGCNSGACVGGNEPVKPIVSSPYDCVDTDGTTNYGKDYYKTGSATSKGGVGGSDFCVEGDAYFNLIEYFCPSNAEASRMGYKCPNGCNNGACI